MKDLIKKILLEKVGNSEIDEARISKYNEQDILDTACQYETMRDFMKNHKNLYQAAWRKNLLLKIKNVCKYKILGNLFERMIYMYIWEENVNAVYFGLTCDEDRRYEEHVGDLGISNVETAPGCDVGSTSAVRKFINENGPFDRYVAVTDGYIPARLAAVAEMCLINHYRNDPDWKDKIIVVNRSQGGELGGKCSVSFKNLFKHSDLVLKEMIQSSQELELKHPRIYKYWSSDPSKKKMFNKRLGKRFFEDAPYTIEEILNLVSNYNSKEEFSQKEKRAFSSAKRQKMLDILFPEAKTYENLETGESYDNLIDVSKKMNINLEDLFNTVKRGQEKKYNLNLSQTKNITESLIRRILKEETEDNEKKGIDIAIKLLKKSYPYIVGWEYNYDLETPSSFYIYLNIICDIEKVKNFYNSELKPYYQKRIKELKEEQFSYPTSILMVSNEIDDQTKFDDYKKMREELNEIYEMLPDHLTTKDTYNDIKSLDPDKFKFV